MNVVELYTTEECGLCREAKEILHKLQKEYPFRIEEQILSEEHPKYREYFLAVPVAIINNGETLSGRIEEKALRAAMAKQLKPSPTILFSKFLEAMGFVTVAAALFYGVTKNDEWVELYFFLAGIALFAIGRFLERRELNKAKN
jgi:thiol-disulfide isomerase/thioredoxin